MSSYKEYTDHELGCLLAQGDRVAYTEIYQRYSGILYLHVLRKLNDKAEAKDIIQELFAALWKNRASFKQDTYLSGYLYASVRYKVINVIAHKQIKSRYIESLKEIIVHGPAEPDHLVREKELRHIIEKEVSLLPAKMRTIFSLSRKTHMSHKEIAKQLDLSEATVKKQVNNALKILRVKLGTFLFILIIFPPSL